MKFLSLYILVLAPILAALLLALPCFAKSEKLTRRFSKTFAGIHFLYSLLFLTFFNHNAGTFQFVQTMDWVKPLGLQFSLGVDGISILLVVLTTFIFFLAFIASKLNINKKHNFYYSLLFILQATILGVFTAKDLLLFFIFWEIELIPMYLLISIWGSGRKEYSAMKFVLYTFFGSLFMLASILALHIFHILNTGVHTFDIQTFINAKDYSYPLMFQIWTFIGFFIAFAVKLPIVPLHTWLPDAHVDAPTPISMILAGVLLKMGGYGLLRFNCQILPEALKVLAPILVILGVINILYAAIIAFAQKDLKKLIAYSSISHMGIVLLGIGAMSIVSLSGAVLQMIAHGVISAGLFMMVGVIYLRTHTRQFEDLGGLGQVMPTIMYLGLVLGLASLGLPLLIGFAAETLVFYGAFISNAFENIQFYTILAASGVILTAGYILWMIQKVFFGNMFEKWKNIKPVKTHEIVVLVSICLVIVIFGFYPSALTNIFANSVSHLIK